MDSCKSWPPIHTFFFPVDRHFSNVAPVYGSNFIFIQERQSGRRRLNIYIISIAVQIRYMKYLVIIIVVIRMFFGDQFFDLSEHRALNMRVYLGLQALRNAHACFCEHAVRTL